VANRLIRMTATAEPVNTVAGSSRLQGRATLAAGTSADVHGPTPAQRAFDVTLALLALGVMLPTILILALLIKLESRGPVFFRCTRAGFRGRELHMLKFRKMRDGATGAELTTSDDARFTRIGAVLAKLKLDEIPQFWHVLRGEMSIVGPRPEAQTFVEHHREAYAEILSVRPGIIGLSQLAFAEEGRILDPARPVEHYVDRILPQKVGLDLIYVRRRSLWMDAKIVFWSALAVLLRRPVAVARDSGELRRRRR
jgi:lipopolysaccharide/colanic/teichoic acid biosynthesis glycosyltransferase